MKPNGIADKHWIVNGSDLNRVGTHVSTGARDESVYAEYKVVLDAADASSYGPLGKRLTEVDAADRKQDINAAN